MGGVRLGWLVALKKKKILKLFLEGEIFYCMGRLVGDVV